MYTPLLTTKLTTPISHSGFVPLPRLFKKLDSSLALPRILTLVAAPAGFGKTTLMMNWLRTVKIGYSWLTLDNGDNDIPRFFNYLIAALQKIDSKIGKSVQTVLESSQYPPIEVITTSIINDINSLPTQNILIIDNYHSINEPAVIQAIQFLIQSQIPQLHIVIITREVPSLPLSQLRAKNLITEITTPDLRFLNDEVAIFLNDIKKLNLPNEQVELLSQRTEGWISGLQLAVTSLQSEAKSIEDFSGHDRFVADFLVDEIFSKLSPEIQTFLIKTSVLTSFNHQLCDAILFENAEAGKSRDILNYLENKNIFIVPLDNKRHWYRYHSLFTEFLKQQLTLMLPHEISDLRVKAGMWYDSNDYFDESIRHFLDAPDFHKAADLIEKRAIKLFLDHGIYIPLESIEALPEELISSRPVLSVVHAFVSLSYFPRSLDIVERRLKDAERLKEEKLQEYDHQTRVIIEKQIAMLRVCLVRFPHKDHQNTINIINEALAIGVDSDLPHQSIFKNYLGEIYLESGDGDAAFKAFDASRYLARLHKQIFVELDSIGMQIRILRLQGWLKKAEIMCRDTLDELVAPLEKEGLFPFSATIYSNLGNILIAKNNLEEGVFYMEEAIKRIELTNYAPQIIETHLVLAYALFNEASGRETIQERLESVIKRFGEARELFDMIFAWYALRSKDLSIANQHVKNRKIDPQLPAPGGDWYETRFYNEQIILIRILVKLCQLGGEANLNTGLKLIENWVGTYQTIGWNGRVLELLLLKTIILEQLKDTGEALVSLRSACKIGKSAGYQYLFVIEGQPMRSLLAKLKTNSDEGDFIDTVLDAFPASKAPSIDSLPRDIPDNIEKLSKREIEILGLIAQGLTSKEIGQRLFITNGTVNVHTNNIFRKLNVDKRTKAVAIAQKLGLL